MLNTPAATAAPVAPPHTRASASPAPTARAARPNDASGGGRTAGTGAGAGRGRAPAWGRPRRRQTLPDPSAVLAERGPARVGLALVGVPGVVVQVDAARRAQTGALGPAQDLGGERQDQRVVGPGAQVELAAGRDVRAVQLLAAAGLVHLAGVDRELRGGVLQAAHARPGGPRGEAQAQRPAAAGHPGDVERYRQRIGPARIGLTAEEQVVDVRVELQPPPLPGG